MIKINSIMMLKPRKNQSLFPICYKRIHFTKQSNRIKYTEAMSLKKSVLKYFITIPVKSPPA
ncbi:hypothetical protein KQQSB11_460074 [Klebsiella quasipneumoniae subsp. quasipneumoniae]|nr:hypothetical protein KQQSB11_460074 [Klebsiella quasipneumoniae subsp. quasipneumoniae]